MNPKNPKTTLKLFSGKRIALVVVASLILVAALALLLAADKTPQKSTVIKNLTTFAVRRDNLTITVSESGSIKAKKSTDLKSEVEGRATITNIVPQGTYITQEDVNNGIVLVELDAGDLREQLTQREIEFSSAQASFEEAKEAYDIQVKQNESDIAQDQLTVKFALMDFQKYLGETLASRIIEEANRIDDPNVDISTIIDIPALLQDANNLGGAAEQSLRELENSILLADEKLERAKNTLDWTKRLKEKDYVSQTELETDQLSVDSLKIQVAQANTDLELFRIYDFSKQTQKLLSDFFESKRALARTYAKARSQLAQRKAQLESARARFNLQQDRLNKARKQVAGCIIKAPVPGLVVYGAGGDDSMHRFRGSGIIAAGEQVFQQQTIISLPDTEMIAQISVHESSVDKVRPAQTATIVMDAFPDRTLHGEVLKVAPLPDQDRSWLSPDIKVYKTDVSIEGTHDYLKPGMSARVEILVSQLTDVLIVPVQVVANRGGKKVCFVATNQGTREREVKTGEFNDTYVQILEGLIEGELVLLNPPRITETKEKAANQLRDRREQQEQQPATQEEQRSQRRPEQGLERPPRMPSDGNQPGSGQFERMKQFGQSPPDFNQLDEETRNRIRKFREMRGDANQLDEETRNRIRQPRERSRRQSNDDSAPK